MLAALFGCAKPSAGPVVYYLDGAGWYSSATSVKQGLEDGGYRGRFEEFSWSAYLGPMHDHLITAKSKGVARRLARHISDARQENTRRQINVLGLSAGTAVILAALQHLPDDIKVDNVVLFSPSVSARHDLTHAMKHVKRNLYATSSPRDGILNAITVNADGIPGRPAGLAGFTLPASADDDTREAYTRVMNLPWKPSYVGFGWQGRHTGVTTRRFVEAVIAPRVLTSEPFPLDRPIVQSVAVADGGS